MDGITRIGLQAGSALDSEAGSVFDLEAGSVFDSEIGAEEKSMFADDAWH